MPRLHAPSDAAAGAALDETNAFSYAEVPRWTWPRQTAPPVIAADVWELLDYGLRAEVGREGRACPLWTRLMMGSSHSVHVLMNISMRIVGMTLPFLLKIEGTDAIDTEGERQLCAGGEDEIWTNRQEV